MLISKYNPLTLDEIKMNDANLDSVIKWCNGWLNGLPDPEKPALLLVGYPGTGKTSTARCIVSDCEWNLIELNASDTRSKEQLSEFNPNQSLFGSLTCILYDECDSVKESGEAIIKKIISSKRFPVIITANNIFNVPKDIKSLCDIVKVYRPSVNSLKSYLYEIIQKENMKVSAEVIDAASNTQDYRLALTMIENGIVLSGSTKNISRADDTRNLVLGEVINTKDPKSLLYYLDENCHKLYSSWDLAKIYEILSRVDQLRRRGKIQWANDLLKTIPKTTLTEFEILSPIKYDKQKSNL